MGQINTFLEHFTIFLIQKQKVYIQENYCKVNHEKIILPGKRPAKSYMISFVDERKDCYRTQESQDNGYSLGMAIVEEILF